MKNKKMKNKNKKDKVLKGTNAVILSQLENIKRESERDKIDVNEQSPLIPSNEKSLIDDFETQLSGNEPLRELFSGKNVRFKTQLTEEQRGAVSVLYHAWKQCTLRGISFDGLKDVLDEYIDFGVSMDRKSREEFVEAQKSYNTNQNMMNQQGIPNQMNNMKM